MKVGDVLEWLAAVAVAYGVWLLAGRAGAAVSAGVALAYFGQCYGGTAIKLPKIHLFKRSGKKTPIH